MQNKKHCLYCNSNNKITGEHVFCDKLGCFEEINIVCSKCNNEELSKLDTAFLDYSPAVYINRFRVGRGIPPFMWSVDHEQDNLHVEGYYQPDSNAIKPVPQLILNNDQFEIRGDAADIEEIGQDNLRNLLVTRAHEALDKNNAEKRFQNQPVPENLLQSPYYFPPRAFVASLDSLKKGGPLYLRFLGSENEQFMEALRSGRNKGLKNYLVKPGSIKGRFFLPFDTRLIQRAIFKFALNAIYHSCESTPVSFATFNNVANVVRGLRIPDRDARRMASALVCPSDEAGWATDKNFHQMRLSHLHGYWHFSLSLFGASLRAISVFPGPSFESWRTREYTIPISPNEWEIRDSIGSLPISGRPSWELKELLPSLQLDNYSTVKLTKGSIKGLKI